MSRLKNIAEYVASNEITTSNVGFLLGQIREYGAEEYSKGYSDHCTHARKRKRIEKKRTSTMFKRFLDWLSDMTHNTEN